MDTSYRLMSVNPLLICILFMIQSSIAASVNFSNKLPIVVAELPTQPIKPEQLEQAGSNNEPTINYHNNHQIQDKLLPVYPQVQPVVKYIKKPQVLYYAQPSAYPKKYIVLKNKNNNKPAGKINKRQDNYGNEEESNEYADYGNNDNYDHQVPAESKHHEEHYEESHEQGHGGEHHEEDHESKGEKGDKGFKKWFEEEKGKKGHHDEDEHKKHYGEKSGEKKKHHHDDGYYKEYHTDEKGEKGSSYEDKEDYKKGHSTHGKHVIHKKDDYEKNVDFFDEDHSHEEHEKHGGYHHEHKKGHGGKKKKGHHKSGHHEDKYGKEKKHKHGSHHHDEEKWKKEKGEKGHHKHGKKYGKKGEHEDGKKWEHKKG
ncbi:histidine-rich glycoprotein-like [Microplitis mediator]|uniref:histidine-rich glycoprotein-like n=1 Tax=Microplitis mediator TaxID=375433 RepID=UPI00255247F8|nr:histidine-rich glycoprotein-like [Microplitis mediator]